MAANHQVNGLPASVASAGRRPGIGRSSLAVAAVWAVALTGGVLGVTTLSGGRDSTPPPRPASAPAATGGGLHLGSRVPTSFGSLSVTRVTDLVGPTRAMHFDVPRGAHPIQLNINLNNIETRPIAFDAGWFRLVGPSDAYAVGYGTPIRRLQPLATRGVLLRFAIAPGAAQLPALEYRDPTGRAPVRVQLGSARNLLALNLATHKHGG